MDRVEIKERAKKFAFQNKLNIWKPFLIIIGISFVVGFVLGILGYTPDYLENGTMVTNPVYDTVTGILTIVLLPLSVGATYYVINLIRGRQMDINEIFSKYKYFLPILVITFLVGLFTALWTILLIIPGIIYAFKVAMVPYLMADELDENTKYMELIDKSKEMMNGYKFDYFVFNLSFIGWILLIPITFGIASIWVVPYVITANAMYYEKLKEKHN